MMQDGMRGEVDSTWDTYGLVKAGSIIASVVLSGTDLAVGAGTVGTTEIANSAITTSKHVIVGLGSPNVWGNRVMAGSLAISAATSDWVPFGYDFLSAPIVTLGTNVAVTVTQPSIGSFLASGANGTIAYWVAIGSA